MSEPEQNTGSSGSAWFNRNFTIYLGGTLSVAVGLWMQRLAVAWLAWEITGSGFWLGVIATADLLPSIVLGPPAGILADRVDRKHLTAWCQAANVAVALALAGVVAQGIAHEYWLLLFGILNGMIASVQQPVRMSLTAVLVEKPQIGRAVAVMSINAHLARFVGPVAVGPILAFGEVSWAFVCAAVLYAVMLVLLPFLRFSDKTREVKEWSGFRTEFVAGFRYTMTHPGIFPIMMCFLLVSVFGRPVFELLPGIVDELFSEGALGLSWLAGAVGAGAVLSSVWLAHRPGRRCTFPVVVGFMLVYGAAALIVSQSTIFWTAVILLAIAGFAVTTTTIAAVAVIQIAVPDEIRGRVMGIYGAIYRAAPAVGAVAMGWASDFLGLRWPIAIGAVVCLVWWLFMQVARARFEAGFEGEND